MESEIRVLIAEDQQLIREGIASLLRIQESIHVVGTATNGQEAIEKVADLSPEIVLMDVRMPVMDGVQATALICSQFSTCQVLMLTTFDDEEYIVEASPGRGKGIFAERYPSR